MNLELAKRLKEAGYPQGDYEDGEEMYGGACYFNETRGPACGYEHIPHIMPGGNVHVYRERYFYVPDTNELLEALGERLLGLLRPRQFNTQGTEDRTAQPFWEALGDASVDGDVVQKKGATPTEVLAELWIAVNA